MPAEPHPRVSLTMIARDAERNLPDCLGSVAGLFDEVIVADTGSADRTKEVAAAHGARAFDFPWCDDFAAARNAALGHATGEWVFWLDADDRLGDDSRARLRALFGALGDEPPVAYAFPYRCPVREPGSAYLADYVRLFPRDPRVRWSGRVHEQVTPSLAAAGYAVRLTDIAVEHAGYADPAQRRRKLERNLRLLLLEDAERPARPYTLFHLGAAYRELGRPAEALPLLERALAGSDPSGQVARKLFALAADCHGRLGWADRALAVCRAGLAHHPGDAELLFVEALALQALGDLGGAEACLRRLVAGQAVVPRLSGIDLAVVGARARHNLAAVLLEQGRVTEAEAEWRSLLEREPHYALAWRGLAEACRRLGRTAEAASITDRLDSLGEAAAAAALQQRLGLDRERVRSNVDAGRRGGCPPSGATIAAAGGDAEDDRPGAEQPGPGAAPESRPAGEG